MRTACFILSLVFLSSCHSSPPSGLAPAAVSRTVTAPTSPPSRFSPAPTPSAVASASPSSAVRFRKAACARNLLCGIDQEGRARCHYYDFGADERYDFATRNPVQGLSVGTGLNPEAITILQDGKLLRVYRFHERDGRSRFTLTQSFPESLGPPVGPIEADSFFTSYSLYGAFKNGRLARLVKNATYPGNDDPYPFHFNGSDWVYNGIFDRQASFFASLLGAKEIAASQDLICGLFPDGSGRCVRISGLRPDARYKDELVDIPATEQLTGVSSGMRTFFWSRTAVFELKEDRNTELLEVVKVELPGVRKIVTPPKEFAFANRDIQPISYLLFEDGRLREVTRDFGPRNAKLLWPGDERSFENRIPDFNHPPAHEELADWKFRDISADGWMKGYTAFQTRFCLLDEKGDLYRYETPTSDNADDITRLEFPTEPDVWL